MSTDFISATLQGTLDPAQYARGGKKVHTILQSVSLASRVYIGEQSGGIWSEQPSRKFVDSCQTEGKRVNGSHESAKHLQDARAECSSDR